jgi:hypothetical protein
MATSTKMARGVKSRAAVRTWSRTRWTASMEMETTTAP